jgi:hypothetical protein
MTQAGKTRWAKATGKAQQKNPARQNLIAVKLLS